MANPNWKKGVSGNPNGRPKGTKNFITILNKALKDAEAKHGKHLIDHAIEKSYESDAVLMAVLKKLIPDRIKAEGLETHFINVIRANIRERTEARDRLPAERVSG